MSDAPLPEKPAEPKPAAFDDTPKKGGVLRIFLFLILAVMLGLAALEVYARMASSAAFEKVEQWVDDPEQKNVAGPEDIHELLGRRPDKPLEDMGNYYQEVYSWRRGRLVDTLWVKVLYAKEEDGKAVLHEVVQNIEPQDGDIPQPPPPSLEDAPDNLAGEGDPDASSDDSNPPEGSGEEAGDDGSGDDDADADSK